MNVWNNHVILHPSKLVKYEESNHSLIYQAKFGFQFSVRIATIAEHLTKSNKKISATKLEEFVFFTEQQKSDFAKLMASIAANIRKVKDLAAAEYTVKKLKIFCRKFNAYSFSCKEGGNVINLMNIIFLLNETLNSESSGVWTESKQPSFADSLSPSQAHRLLRDELSETGRLCPWETEKFKELILQYASRYDKNKLNKTTLNILYELDDSIVHVKNYLEEILKNDFAQTDAFFDKKFKYSPVSKKDASLFRAINTIKCSNFYKKEAL